MRKLFTIVYSAVVLVEGVPFVRERSARNNCNIEGITHCCQNVTSPNNPPATAQILESFGFRIPLEAGTVVSNCTKADGTSSCHASPVCCEGNTSNHAPVNCNPVNENPG